MDTRALALSFVTPDRQRARRIAEIPAGAERLPIDGIAAWRWGAGETVLLVHGWEGSHHDLLAFVDPLRDAGFAVAALDLPGHGESAGDIAPLPAMAEAVRRVGMTVGPLKGIVAHSVGCPASSVAVHRGLAVERMVLLASPARYERTAQTVARAKGLDATGWSAMRARLLELGAEFNGLDMPEIGAAMTHPTLFVHSADDRIVPLTYGREAAATWPKALFREVDGLGHARLLGDPAVIAEAVAFMKAEH